MGATIQYIDTLHTECDFILKYFDMRKEARAGEIDSLEKAVAVLNGADYSLVQTRSTKFLQNHVISGLSELSKHMLVSYVCRFLCEFVCGFVVFDA